MDTLINTSVGGIVILVTEPDYKTDGRSVMGHEDRFIKELRKLDGFKGFDSSGPSIVQINRVIPIIFEVPDGVKINNFITKTILDVQLAWEKCARK